MTRKAALIGINKYKDAPLRGCVNDVLDFYDYLIKESGFKQDDVRMLLDERATTEAILSRAHWLKSGARAGDHLVFQVSGHGTLIRRWHDHSLASMTEACLVPYNYNWDNEDSFITDGDLDMIFTDLPTGVDLTLIFDTCHSGGMRDLAPTGSKRAAQLARNPYAFPGTETVRFLPPPLDVAARVTDRELPSRQLGRWLEVDVSEPWRTLAACQENQTAIDGTFGDHARPNGAFTWSLLQSLRRGQARTWLQIIEDAKGLLKEDGFAQLPVLRAPAPGINGYPWPQLH